MEISFRSPSRG